MYDDDMKQVSIRESYSNRCIGGMVLNFVIQQILHTY